MSVSSFVKMSFNLHVVIVTFDGEGKAAFNVLIGTT